MQIFDSWGSICPATHYEAWSLRWIHHIIKELKERVPVILYAKGMGQKVPELMQTGANILSLDWTMNLRSMRQSIGHGQQCKEPRSCCPNDDSDITRREAQRVLDEAGDQPGFIFNGATA